MLFALLAFVQACNSWAVVTQAESQPASTTATSSSIAICEQAPAVAPSPDRAALAVLDEYLDALNRLELAGVTACYHFPHFRVRGTELVIWETPLQAMPMLALPATEQKAALQKGLGDGWHMTVWGERELVTIGKDKVHVATELIRLRKDGSVIHRFESFYVVTLEQGRWAIKGRSSYAPR